MKDYNIINNEVKNILKKHDPIGYLLFKLNNSNYTDILNKRILKLYLNSLTQEDLLLLKNTEKEIKNKYNIIERELLSTVFETYILDQPHTFCDKNIKKYASIIMLRDKEGFYAVNEPYQKYINNNQQLFVELEDLLTLKESLMNGSRTMRPNSFNRREIIFLSNYLGYGNVREEILIKQKRKNNYQKRKK